MELSQEATEHSERLALADRLSVLREAIERRWLQRVSAQLNRQAMSETELRDSIPDYLVALVAGLRKDDGDRLGTDAWAEVARKHALTRLHSGFDIDEVMREFEILRHVIMEVLQEERVAPTAEQGNRINNLIGGAIRAFVKSYVEHRDHESRSLQARHIGFITHELRTPLATAMAAGGQIRKYVAAGKDPSRPLELLERNLKRMRDLIDDTLQEQRLEVGDVPYHPEQILLGELMDEATRGAQESAQQKGIELKFSFDPEVLMQVDRKLALSALQNIIENAVKFTDRGEIEVQVRDGEPGEVVVDVVDECEGLSADEQRTLFEPFNRGHSVREGTGLGLAIARRAVEAHGKKIHVESDGRKGCHFWFALPRASH